MWGSSMWGHRHLRPTKELEGECSAPWVPSTCSFLADAGLVQWHAQLQGISSRSYEKGSNRQRETNGEREGGERDIARGNKPIALTLVVRRQWRKRADSNFDDIHAAVIPLQLSSISANPLPKLEEAFGKNRCGCEDSAAQHKPVLHLKFYQGCNNSLAKIEANHQGKGNTLGLKTRQLSTNPAVLRISQLHSSKQRASLGPMKFFLTGDMYDTFRVARSPARRGNAKLCNAPIKHCPKMCRLPYCCITDRSTMEPCVDLKT